MDATTGIMTLFFFLHEAIAQGIGLTSTLVLKSIIISYQVGKDKKQETKRMKLENLNQSIEPQGVKTECMFSVCCANLKVRDPFFDLTMRSDGTEPVNSFSDKFLERATENSIGISF